MLESKSSALTSLATPLHGSTTKSRQPIYVASDRVSDLIIFSVRPSHEGVNGQIAALANLPARGGLGELRFARHRCKYRTSRTGHPRFESLVAEPFDGF